MPPLSKEVVEKGFGRQGLQVLQDKEVLEKYLNSITLRDTNLLLMSSGNYDGLDLQGWISEKLANFS